MEVDDAMDELNKKLLNDLLIEHKALKKQLNIKNVDENII